MIDYSIFHKLFVLYFLVSGLIRAYYTGFAYSSDETVTRAEEGALIFYSRFLIAIPVLIVSLLYILNPAWVYWLSIDLYISLRWFGVVISGIGLVLFYLTHYYLGKNFTDTVHIRQKAKLVVSGPYRWVRHPMYTSGVLLTVGTGLMTQNWFIGFAGTFFVLLVMFVRTPIEEAKLIERFGDAYKNYMEHTPRYSPGITLTQDKTKR